MSTLKSRLSNLVEVAQRVANGEPCGNSEARNIKIRAFRVIYGFDSGTGEMSQEALENIIKVIRKKLALVRTDRILEVSCGSGMILESLSKTSSMVAGVDFANSLIVKI